MRQVPRRRKTCEAFRNNGHDIRKFVLCYARFGHILAIPIVSRVSPIPAKKLTTGKNPLFSIKNPATYSTGNFIISILVSLFGALCRSATSNKFTVNE